MKRTNKSLQVSLAVAFSLISLLLAFVPYSLRDNTDSENTSTDNSTQIFTPPKISAK